MVMKIGHRLRPDSIKAFTLIELSIVLVIIGLIVGGVLTGRSLIRASELRSVVTQFQGYVSAVNAFRDKYSALPGDMTNATTIWGAVSSDQLTCISNIGTGTQTCNGDGNGQILIESNEEFRFWQQLANAGLIAGRYTGFHGPGGLYDSIPDTNVPPGKLSNSGWHAEYYELAADNGSDFIQSGNRMLFGARLPGERTRAKLLKPEEAANIDIKMDDGKNGTGRIITWALNVLPECGTTSNSTTSLYNISNTAIACALIFKNPF